MGYEIRIDLINVSVKKEHVDLIKKAIKGELEGVSDIYYMIKNLKVLRNRLLSWGQEGNGDNWAYEFDGEGNMTMCSGRRAAAIKGLINKAKRANHSLGASDGLG